jgi:hypothetical protein
MLRDRRWGHALGIVAAALAVRLLFAWLLDWRADYATGDSGIYLAGQSAAFRAPGYFAFARTLGPLLLPAQAVLGIAGAVAAWFALKGHDRRLAAVSAAALAISPLPVPIELRVLSETLYGFLVLVALLCLFDRRSVAAGIVSGAAMGLAMLTRDTLLLLPLFVLPFIPWRQGLAFAAAAYLIAAPGYLGRPDQGRAGFALWIGTWERSPDWQAERRFPAYAFRSSAEREQLTAAFDRKDFRPFEAAATDRMRQDPAGVIEAWMIRYPRLWLSTRTELNTVTHWRLPLKTALWMLNLLVLVLGLVGAATADKQMRLFWAPILYGALIYVPFHNTEPRYILFTVPFLTIFACGVVMRIWDGKVERSRNLKG